MRVRVDCADLWMTYSSFLPPKTLVLRFLFFGFIWLIIVLVASVALACVCAACMHKPYEAYSLPGSDSLLL